MRVLFSLLACSISKVQSRRLQTDLEQLRPEHNSQGVHDHTRRLEKGPQPVLSPLKTNLFAVSSALPSSGRTLGSIPPATSVHVQTRSSSTQMSNSQAYRGVEPIHPQPVVDARANTGAGVEAKADSVSKKPFRKWLHMMPALAAMRAAPAVAAAATAGVNQQAAALGFFGNLRVPATLLTGTSLAALFVNLPDHHGQKFSILRTVYEFLAAATIAFELTTVFMSTTMGVRMIAGGFDPIAATTVAFLRREFEFEYIACRLCFFTGILSFLSMIAVRAWLTFAEKQPDIGRAFVFLFLTVASFFDSFWRHTVVNYGGYFQMLRRCIFLFFFDFLPKQPLLNTIGLIACWGGVAGAFAMSFRMAYNKTGESQRLDEDNDAGNTLVAGAAADTVEDVDNVDDAPEASDDVDDATEPSN